jgi:hypothetical protein
MSEIIKYITGVILSRKSLTIAMIVIFTATAMADPASYNNSRYFYLLRLVHAFSIELTFILMIIIMFEFGLIWPSVLTAWRRFEVACARASKSKAGSVVSILALATVMLAMSTALAAAALYFKVRVWDRVANFPTELDSQIRREVFRLSVAHKFPEALKLIYHYRAVFPSQITVDDGASGDDDPLVVRERDLKARMEIARLLNQQAERVRVKGQDTRDTMQRLRRSYSIYRNPEILSRINIVQNKIAAALPMLTPKSDACNTPQKDIQANYVRSYAWVLLNDAELTDAWRQTEFGVAERPLRLMCDQLIRMGDKVESRVHELWGLGM